MKLLKTILSKSGRLIAKKLLEIVVAIITAMITALTTTSCMGYGPL